VPLPRALDSKQLGGRSKPSLTASASGLAFAAAVATFTAANAQPVFRAALEMVNVTVTAHDATGRPVPDLRAEELSVREDGRPQTVLLFAPAAQTENREKLALNLGMLLDISLSMKREIKLSRESAIRFLEAVPRARDLLLIFFDNDIRIAHYASERQQNIVERIPGRGGGSATLLYDAIAVYLSRVAETPGRKVLVLFSDGDDNASRVNSAEVTRLLRASDVVVYPIAFQGERPNRWRVYGPAPSWPRWLRSAEAECSRRTPRSRCRPSTSRSWRSWAASTCWAMSPTTPRAMAAGGSWPSS